MGTGTAGSWSNLFKYPASIIGEKISFKLKLQKQIKIF